VDWIRSAMICMVINEEEQRATYGQRGRTDLICDVERGLWRALFFVAKSRIAGIVHVYVIRADIMCH
jgi:hypothetical protein